MSDIGYVRVSTQEQNSDMQKDALHRASIYWIYEDTASGKTAERQELQHCLKALRPGDTLVVWRLDRLGRNLKELIAIVADLERRGIGFRSLTESIDTTGPAGKLVFHIFGALAEFERELLSQRTLAGLAAARARGRVGGRPPSIKAGAQREMLLALMRDRTQSVSDIARQFKVSRSTLYKLAADNAPQPSPHG